MNRLSKKRRIVILIIAIILIIVGIRVFTKSRASKTLEITANFKDEGGLLSDEISTVTATDEGENGTSFVLPDFANDKKVNKYILEQKNIESSNEENQQNIIEMLPGDKIYLTQDEIEQSQIELKVEYDTKDINEKKLYNKKLIKPSDDNKEELVSVVGYMPADTQIQVTETDIANVQDEIETNYPNKDIIGNYNTKLISSENEYIPSDYGEKVNISILTNENQENTILEIDNNKVQQIPNVVIDGN